MSSTEDETTTTEESALAPAANLDDLFEDVIDEEVDEVEIPENLTEDELRSRLAKASKQVNFERTERLKVARKAWGAEAKEHFPYSKPEAIKAESRRAFLEEAKNQDADFRERAQPIISKAEKTEEDLRAEIRAELEKEAGAAWGKPFSSGGGSAQGAEAAETDKRLEGARKRRNLHEAATALMDGRRI